MNPMFMRPQNVPMGQDLPQIPRQQPIYGNPTLGALPPIPGFDPAQMPQGNPLGGEHLFYQNNVDGQTTGPSLENPGTYVPPSMGNPLYYGRTGAYTGPQGPTDTIQPPTQTVSPIETAAPAITFEDALMFTFGMPGSNPKAESYNNMMNIPKMRDGFQRDFGFGLADQFDPSKQGWKDALAAFNMDAQQDRSR